MALRALYLHGFASGPRSTKGVAFAQHFAARGLAIERLDLRVPSFERLRLSAMIDVAQAALGGPDDRAVVFGSSLGGLTAARLAERDARVVALVLLAPAFQLVERWRTSLGPAFDEWRRTGWREVHDHASQQPARIDFGFVEDAAAVDVGFPAVAVPTLILHGRRDDVVPLDHSHRFIASTPAPHRIELVEIEDGHELVASLPRLLTESTQFLDRLRARSA